METKSRKNFFQHLRGSISIYPDYPVKSVQARKLSNNFNKNDEIKIRGDFFKIGNDLRKAVNKYDRQQHS
jgi:hypothetical protein